MCGNFRGPTKAKRATEDTKGKSKDGPNKTGSKPAAQKTEIWTCRTRGILSRVCSFHRQSRMVQVWVSGLECVNGVNLTMREVSKATSKVIRNIRALSIQAGCAQVNLNIIVEVRTCIRTCSKCLPVVTLMSLYTPTRTDPKPLLQLTIAPPVLCWSLETRVCRHERATSVSSDLAYARLFMPPCFLRRILTLQSVSERTALRICRES